MTESKAKADSLSGKLKPNPKIVRFEKIDSMTEEQLSPGLKASGVKASGVKASGVQASGQDRQALDQEANRTAAEDPNSDLGFGRVLSQQRELRLLNRDGSFNVQKRGRGLHTFLSYSSLVTTSWPRFFLFVAVGYGALNALFAIAFLLCGPGAVLNTIDTGVRSHFLRVFFFSIHTSATIGYGITVPIGVAANVLVSLESVVSLLGLAVVTGLVFARFSRPVADILYSRSAIISKFGKYNSFQFRIINSRNSQIIDLHARVMVARFESRSGSAPVRRYYPLTLERESVAFFPLSWTVVHVIDESSPLFGVTEEELLGSAAEFLVLLTGVEETFSQVVNSRSSYRADEIIWNAKFADIFVYDLEGRTAGVDLDRFHETISLAPQQ
jgi:inward rectifier potassium channel